MRSSTSSSEKSARRGTVVLLAGCLAILLFFEVGARYGFARLSKSQARIKAERAQFLATHGPDTTVLVGNSLLLTDIDVDQLTKETHPGTTPRQAFTRFAIEQTDYYDWYFGLRNLLSQGARPERVILVFDASHWLSNGVRGEYFGRELFDRHDLFDLRDRLHLDRTTLSSYWFANVSAWLGGRTEIRKFLLTKLAPQVQPFFTLLGRRDFRFPTADEAYPEVAARMETMKRLLDSYGVKLFVVIPPTQNGLDAQLAILRAGQKLGVPTLRPWEQGTFSGEEFDWDTYHLNPKGEAHFTHNLAAALSRF